MEEFSKEWFNDTSKEWRKNKRKMKGCIFRYMCEMRTNGKKCWRDVCLKSVYCRQQLDKQPVVELKNEIYVYNISTEQTSLDSQTTSKLPT